MKGNILIGRTSHRMVVISVREDDVVRCSVDLPLSSAQWVLSQLFREVAALEREVKENDKPEGVAS